MSTKKPEVIVIGAGQAGLAAGHHLARRGVGFLILDAEAHVGDQWRRRWDSLRLFTPAKHSGLPGAAWQRPGSDRPGKDDTAAYLAGYAARWQLPIRSACPVSHVSYDGADFVVTTPDDQLRSPNLIVATGAATVPHIPDVATDCAARIAQLHSSGYRNPGSVPGARALVVGFGTSGAEIALELAESGREVVLAGRPTPVIPGPLLAVAGDLWWLLLTRVFTRATPIGRRMAPVATAHGAPLIGISPRLLRDAGVQRAGRLETTIDGKPVVDGEPLDVDAIVWCTGFRGDFGWLDLAGLEFDERGYPIAPFGIPGDPPGLGFVGMPFQARLASPLLGGVGEDAEHVVGTLLATRPIRGAAPA